MARKQITRIQTSGAADDVAVVPPPRDVILEELRILYFGNDDGRGLINQNQEKKKIEFYDQFYQDAREEWYREFVVSRIREKCGTIYPDCKQDNLDFILTQHLFISYFIDNYLRVWRKHSLFQDIATKILDNSRSTPTQEYSLGKPTLDHKIRQENESYLLSLQNRMDDVYNPHLDKYMQKVLNNGELEQWDDFFTSLFTGGSKNTYKITYSIY
jgi:hypothetical protein